MSLPLKKLDNMDWQIIALMISWAFAFLFLGIDWIVPFWIIISFNVVAASVLAVKLLNNKRKF